MIVGPPHIVVFGFTPSISNGTGHGFCSVDASKIDNKSFFPLSGGQLKKVRRARRGSTADISGEVLVVPKVSLSRALLEKPSLEWKWRQPARPISSCALVLDSIPWRIASKRHRKPQRHIPEDLVSIAGPSCAARLFRAAIRTANVLRASGLPGECQRQAPH